MSRLSAAVRLIKSRRPIMQRVRQYPPVPCTFCGTTNHITRYYGMTYCDDCLDDRFGDLTDEERDNKLSDSNERSNHE
jgi:hypothetical protein